MSELVKWLMKPEAGNFCIGGHGSKVWGDFNVGCPQPSTFQLFGNLLSSIFWKRRQASTRPDLVAPHMRKPVDGLTQWIANEWTPFWFALGHRDLTGRKDEERPSGEKASTAPVQEDGLANNPRLVSQY
jgi:hypothetical protein